MTNFAKAIAFAWAVAFAKWPTSNMVSFLEYLVFFAQTNSNALVESFFVCFFLF